MAQLRGILVDWGGVLTTPLADSVAGWLEADRIDAEGYREVMLDWVRGAYGGSGGANPVHALERGEVEAAEFERLLAARLRTRDGGPVAAAGLLARMFAGFAPVEPMYEALRRARTAGIRTCLLSNSWANDYPRDLFGELFDAVVISGEVGMRKPDEEIFRYALREVGLEPAECVFIDDIQHNVTAAAALGITGLRHIDPAATLTWLETAFAVPFTGGAPAPLR